MNTNQIDEKDENFMIFKLEDLDLKDLDLKDLDLKDLDLEDLDLEDLDLEYSNKYIYQKNNIENNYKYIYYNNNNYNINKDLVFKLPKPIDSSKRKIYILSDYEKKNKKVKLQHC